MTDIDYLVEVIGEIITALAGPLTEDEISGGWTDKSKIHYHRLFLDFQTDLLSKSRKPWPTQFARGLDYWGVIEGDLHEKIMYASAKLREIEDKIRNPLEDSTL